MVRTVVLPLMINLLQFNITQQNPEGKIDFRWWRNLIRAIALNSHCRDTVHKTKKHLFGLKKSTGLFIKWHIIKSMSFYSNVHTMSDYLNHSA